jgi:hypothetical protein
MKHVKEITSYEFDINSFEKNAAYKIKLPTIGMQRFECVAILDVLDSTTLVFITNQYEERSEIKSIGGTSIYSLTININDYLKGDISIVKLGVIEPNEGNI